MFATLLFPPSADLPRSTTPRKPKASNVRQFCASLSPCRPVLLPFIPVSPLYAARCCHINVLHRVREAGGRRVFGWLIWQLGAMLDAEFHAVWEAPEGRLVDLTPRPDGERLVLFLPDPVRRLDATSSGLALTWGNRTNVPGLMYPQGERYVIRDTPFTRVQQAALGFVPGSTVAGD